MTNKSVRQGRGAQGAKGYQAAVDAALAERKAEEALDAQLEMLGLPPDDDEVRKKLRPYAGRGRPPGAKNRRTTEMADYLLKRYGSPLEPLAQIYATPTDVLAKALGCTKLEALQERRLAAIAVKRHVHSEMPVAVNVNERREIHLTIVDGLPDARGIGLVDDLVESVDPKLIDAVAKKPEGSA